MNKLNNKEVLFTTWCEAGLANLNTKEGHVFH